MSLWCRHQNQTVPRKDEQGEYCRCLECGRRIPWSWADDFPIRPPRLWQPEAMDSNRIQQSSSPVGLKATNLLRFVKPPNQIASKKGKILSFLREARIQQAK